MVLEELLGHRKSELTGSGAVASMFIEKAGVAVVAGDPLGDDNAFRISISSSDEYSRGINQNSKSCQRLYGAKVEFAINVPFPGNKLWTWAAGPL